MGNAFILYGVGVFFEEKDSPLTEEDRDKLDTLWGRFDNSNEEVKKLWYVSDVDSGGNIFVGNVIARNELGYAIKIDSTLEEKAKELMPHVQKQLKALANKPIKIMR